MKIKEMNINTVLEERWENIKKPEDGYGFQSFADVLEHPACALRLVFSDSEQFGYTTLGDIRNNIDKQL